MDFWKTNKNQEQYITLTFDKIENGLGSTLKVNGEFVKAESSNNGIITYKDGVLEAKAMVQQQ